MNDYFKELYSYSESLEVINTHSHHPDEQFFETIDLDSLLRSSYANWCGVEFDNTSEKRANYLEKVRYNSYFVWLEKAIQKIYEIEEPITAENWDRVSMMIAQANIDKEHQLDILKNECRYKRILLDNVYDSGSDNGHPEIFTPVFRVNVFSYGYSDKILDRYGTNPAKRFGIMKKDIDEYIAIIENIIAQKINEGCVALKSIAAYERTLDFNVVSKSRAQKAMTCSDDERSAEDIKAFGDYIFFEICRIAAKYDIPLQCHTGLAKLEKTNAMQLHDAIRMNPDTKFVLFHGGYPWADDIFALTHNYKNVFPDICWLPLISTSAAERVFEELIEVSVIDRICWGCDAHSAEESMGALLAARFVIANVLSKKVGTGYLSFNDAQKIVKKVLFDNAKALYKL